MTHAYRLFAPGIVQAFPTSALCEFIKAGNIQDCLRHVKYLPNCNDSARADLPGLRMGRQFQPRSNLIGLSRVDLPSIDDDGIKSQVCFEWTEIPYLDFSNDSRGVELNIPYYAHPNALGNRRIVDLVATRLPLTMELLDGSE